MISTLAVCVGVYWEKEGNPEAIKREGWLLAVWGIALEILFSVFLWQIDSSISAQQRAEIIRLTTPRNLSPDAVKRVEAKVCPFGSPPFQITSVTFDEILLRNEFSQIIRTCKWNDRVASGADQDSLIASLSGLVGIRFGYSPDHAEQFGPVSKAFADALVAEGINARAEVIPPSVIPTINVIEIQIGQRP